MGFPLGLQAWNLPFYIKQNSGFALFIRVRVSRKILKNAVGNSSLMRTSNRPATEGEGVLRYEKKGPRTEHESTNGSTGADGAGALRGSAYL